MSKQFFGTDHTIACISLIQREFSSKEKLTISIRRAQLMFSIFFYHPGRAGISIIGAEPDWHHSFHESLCEWARSLKAKYCLPGPTFSLLLLMK